MEPLTSAPETSSFIPLADHQSRTPSSFYSGPPVLHYHSQRCKIVVLEREVLAAPALNALRGESASANTSTQDDDEKEIAIDGVDVWVTSE
jgi:nucleotide-sensitive chloride channel 1A